MASALAVWTGFRYGMTRTLVPTAIRGVTVSRYMTAVSGSSQASSGPSGKAPVGEYDKMARGFTPDELAKRGIKQVQQGELSRTDPHVYMRAVQKSEAGLYAKYFVLFRTSDQTVLVSVNVPQHSLDDGAVKTEEVERVLATAKTTEKPAVRDLYSLSYLGPFKEAGRLDRHTPKTSSKGKGFVQPFVPHEHWHVDVSYINIAGTFYYLCSLLDGCSRFTVP